MHVLCDTHFIEGKKTIKPPTVMSQSKVGRWRWAGEGGQLVEVAVNSQWQLI